MHSLHRTRESYRKCGRCYCWSWSNAKTGCVLPQCATRSCGEALISDNNVLQCWLFSYTSLRKTGSSGLMDILLGAQTALSWLSFSAAMATDRSAELTTSLKCASGNGRNLCVFKLFCHSTELFICLFLGLKMSVEVVRCLQPAHTSQLEV